ncbi:MAG: hypothetical protein AAGH15_12740 [Myxococcota bacterium]
MRFPLACALVLTLTAHARAGNGDSFFQGNEAALLGGAVASVGTGPDLLYYNPAGLALNTRHRLELSGQLFELQVRRLDPLIRLVQTDDVLDEVNHRAVDYQTVPSALSYVYQLNDRLSAGAGVFVLRQSSFDLRAELEEPEQGRSLVARANFESDQTYFTAGFGWAALPWLRVGLNAGVSYQTTVNTQRAVLELSPDGPAGTRTAAGGLYSELDVTEIAADFTLGLQADLPRGLKLGLVVRGPRLRIVDDIVVDAALFEIQPGPRGDVAAYFPIRGEIRNASRRAWIAPFETVLSVGWVHEAVRLSVEADLIHAHDKGLVEKDFTWNVRVGAAFRVSETAELGFGLFTDRDDESEQGNDLVDLDFYGVSTGLTLDTPVELAGADLETADGRRLVFRTTIGLRYAFGTGELDTIDGVLDDALDSDPATVPISSGPFRRVVFHEAAVYLGSGLDF